jgi:hypothetical protein
VIAAYDLRMSSAVTNGNYYTLNVKKQFSMTQPLLFPPLPFPYSMQDGHVVKVVEVY